MNPLRELAHLQTQPLQIVFLTSQVKKCLGCTNYFTAAERKEPIDLIFMVFMQRPRPYNNNQWGRAEWKSQAYFHTHNMECFGKFKELKCLKRKDIYMTNNVYGQLTKGHISYLQELDMWQHIRHNRNIINKVLHFVFVRLKGYINIKLQY